MKATKKVLQVKYGIVTVLICLLANPNLLFAQQADTIKNDWFSFHAQATVVNQFKPAFHANYSGQNSLSTSKESATSITTTLYMGARLWKGASVYFNPEIAGGSGLTQALGIADATNGETFRIGSPAPKIYVARLYYRQVFALSKTKIYQQPDQNQLGEWIPEKYLAATVGKVSAADFFDDNKYSHDPRSQFMSWGLMDNGAWDYPANTRGYTPSVMLEYVTPKHELRYGISLLPLLANGNDMDWDLHHSSSQTIEYTHRHSFRNRPGAIRVLAFYSTTHMGNYREAIQMNPTAPSIVDTRKYGRSKYGFGLNADQEFTDNLGGFFRASWNDGTNETWAFTEIDHSISAGLVLNGTKWKRSDDKVGLAYVASGISKPHRDYLKAGGHGFMLGDGNLNYGWENLAELYYSAALANKLVYITGTYQFLVNPGYNRDRRGPVSVFSIRVHLNI